MTIVKIIGLVVRWLHAPMDEASAKTQIQKEPRPVMGECVLCIMSPTLAGSTTPALQAMIPDLGFTTYSTSVGSRYRWILLNSQLTIRLGNPYGCEWGNMSWGHVLSRDLVNWENPQGRPALKPDQDYDHGGVFTGCLIPCFDGSNDPLVVCYSAVRKLPFHWSTPPYPRNAAGIAIATSSDSGMTWEKSSSNPVLQGEPNDIQVTGFRDPYVAAWPALDRVRGAEKACTYALVSGGVEGAGPTTFLYALDSCDVTDWQYIGPLVNMPMRYSPSPLSELNFGMNWECTNFMTFGKGRDQRNFLIVGAEGDVEREHIAARHSSQQSLTRTIRQQLWMCGDLVLDRGSVELKYRYGGILDHGSYYAANSFQDPRSGKRIVHGWIPEEDCTAAFATRKGWNGSLALPREILLLSILDVHGAIHTPLSELTSIERKENGHGSWDLTTLGVRPLDDLRILRENCANPSTLRDIKLLPETTANSIATLHTLAWEVEAVVFVPETCRTFSLDFRDQETLSTRFKLSFSLEHETISVIRNHSDTTDTFNDCVERGSFTLFRTRASDSTTTALELLRLRIYSDGDVLEVFANDRFALATMVYHDQKGGSVDVVPSVAGGAGTAVLKEINIWDGLQKSC
jgi:beta-fructofuranosidase